MLLSDSYYVGMLLIHFNVDKYDSNRMACWLGAQFSCMLYTDLLSRLRIHLHTARSKCFTMQYRMMCEVHIYDYIPALAGRHMSIQGLIARARISRGRTTAS